MPPNPTGLFNRLKHCLDWWAFYLRHNRIPQPYHDRMCSCSFSGRGQLLHLFWPLNSLKGLFDSHICSKSAYLRNIQQSVGFRGPTQQNLWKMLGNSIQLKRHRWITWGSCIIGCLVLCKEKKVKEQEKKRVPHFSLAGHLSCLWEAPGADCGAL